MTKYIMRNSTYIFRNNVAATFDESVCTCSQCQIDRRTRRTTERNHIFQFLQVILFRETCSKHYINNISFYLFIQINLTNHLSCFQNLF